MNKGKRLDVKRADPTMLCPHCQSQWINSKNVRNGARMYKCSDCSKYFTVSLENRDKRRVLVISDLHCGHISGLTPEKYNLGNDEFAVFREEAWKWYSDMLKRLQPIDIVIVNGDAIDGRQEKSGGSELLVADRLIQVDMAIDCIRETQGRQIYMTHGTPYHTGKLEQFEQLIARAFDAPIFNKLRLNVNGCMIDARHKIGRSNIPHGRFTALARSSMWNDLMSMTSEKANVIIRSHVHYFTLLEHSNNRVCFTTPALQGDTDYGSRECEGNVDFGFVLLEVSAQGVVDSKHLYKKTFETKINPIINAR